MFNFDTPFMIITGIVTGLVFGFLLQRATVTRYQTILGQFLFKDFTVLKVMLTAIVVGAIGIWGLRALGQSTGWEALQFKMHVKNAALMGAVLGGGIFGVGMALLGYCPGTGAAAVGDGSRHALWGILGMLFGGGIYAEVFPFIKDSLLKIGVVEAQVAGETTSKITFTDLSGISPWWFIALLVMIASGVFLLIEHFENRPKPSGKDPKASPPPKGTPHPA